MPRLYDAKEHFGQIADVIGAFVSLINISFRTTKAEKVRWTN